MVDTAHQDLIRDQFTRQATPFSTAAPIANEAALKMIIDAAEPHRDDTLLDVACGGGIVVCAFAPLRSGEYRDRFRRGRGGQARLFSLKLHALYRRRRVSELWDHGPDPDYPCSRIIAKSIRIVNKKIAPQTASGADQAVKWRAMPFPHYLPR